MLIIKYDNKVYMYGKCVEITTLLTSHYAHALHTVDHNT